MVLIGLEVLRVSLSEEAGEWGVLFDESGGGGEKV